MFQFVRTITIPVHVSHHNPRHAVAALLDGRSVQNAAKVCKTDHKSRTKPRHTTSYCGRKPDSVRKTCSRMPQAHSKNRLPLSPDRRIAPPRRSDTLEPPCTPNGKSEANRRKLRSHHSSVTDGTLSPCSRPPKASAKAAVGLCR